MRNTRGTDATKLRTVIHDKQVYINLDDLLIMLLKYRKLYINSDDLVKTLEEIREKGK